MSYQEKRSIVTMVGTLLISGIWGIYMFNKAKVDNLDFENDLEFWAKSILIFIGAAIISLIIIHIIFHFINAVATGEEEDGSFEDERDKLIELKSARYSSYAFMIGFVLAMIFLALGNSISVMFITLISSCVIGGVVEGISQIIYYRKGV